jgi:hypothetical protein
MPTAPLLSKDQNAAATDKLLQRQRANASLSLHGERAMPQVLASGGGRGFTHEVATTPPSIPERVMRAASETFRAGYYATWTAIAGTVGPLAASWLALAGTRALDAVAGTSTQQFVWAHGQPLFHAAITCLNDGGYVVMVTAGVSLAGLATACVAAGVAKAQRR